jgi:hypothetical protein
MRKINRFIVRQDRLSGNYMVMDMDHESVIDMYIWPADARQVAKKLNKQYPRSED